MRAQERHSQFFNLMDPLEGISFGDEEVDVTLFYDYFKKHHQQDSQAGLENFFQVLWETLASIEANQDHGEWVTRPRDLDQLAFHPQGLNQENRGQDGIQWASHQFWTSTKKWEHSDTIRKVFKCNTGTFESEDAHHYQMSSVLCVQDP